MVGALHEIARFAIASRNNALHTEVDLRARERTFHPIRDYLHALPWDGERRLHSWLNRYLGVEHSPYASKIGEMFLIAMVARVFDPANGPCYECTMGENDWKMLEARRSCALLSRSEMEHGKVPTTPTTAAVVAGIQTQEAVKLLHGLDTLAGAPADSKPNGNAPQK